MASAMPNRKVTPSALAAEVAFHSTVPQGLKPLKKKNVYGTTKVVPRRFSLTILCDPE